MSAQSKSRDTTRFEVVDKWLLRFLGLSVALLIAAMVIVIWLSVFTRYVMSDPVGWGEQVAKYLMIWATFLGASLGIRAGAHIAVDLLVDSLPRQVARICVFLATTLTGGFLVLCIYYGVIFAYKVREHSDPLVGEMSMSLAYAAIPVGCLAMLVQLGLKMTLGISRTTETASVV